MPSELKPCPRCGYIENDKPRIENIVCGDCLRTNIIKDYEDIAICLCGRIISRREIDLQWAKERVFLCSKVMLGILFRYGVRNNTYH